jgi:hypothetical protein
MMINRRTFVQSAALVAATPALASLLFVSSDNETEALQHPEPIPLPHPAAHKASDRVLFKIHGWDCCNDFETDHSDLKSVDRVFNTSNDDRTVVRMTQSWHTAWR